MSEMPCPEFNNEPNLISARRKNDSGLCCHDECKNQLSYPPDTAYFGLKVCKECRVRLDAVCKEIQNGNNRETDERTFNALRILLGLK